jgi:hypothetical protein
MADRARLAQLLALGLLTLMLACASSNMTIGHHPGLRAFQLLEITHDSRLGQRFNAVSSDRATRRLLPFSLLHPLLDFRSTKRRVLRSAIGARLLPVDAAIVLVLLQLVSLGSVLELCCRAVCGRVFRILPRGRRAAGQASVSGVDPDAGCLWRSRCTDPVSGWGVWYMWNVEHLS